MFVLENTACLSTFVKMSIYNSKENICSVYISVFLKKSVTYKNWKDKIMFHVPL